MNNHPDLVNNFLHNHFVSTLFDVDVIDYSAGKIVLGFHARGPVVAGSLGCMVDCVARIAAHSSLGNCFVSEYELSSSRQSDASDYVVSLGVEQTSEEDAIYHCEITAKENSVFKSIAVSQGTLSKIN